MVQLLPKVNLT